MSHQPSKIRYVHNEGIHNLKAPSVIVKDLVADLAPKSVVDIGCGIGNFLAVFEREGVKDVLGVDGDWVDRSKLYIDEDKFASVDLEYPLDLGRSFDLALCVEVAEHLKPEAADTLVETLCRLSKVIVFSAAIPGQGGEGHLNEQPYSYWQERFASHNFHFHEVFRERYWQVEEIEWWYRQNLFLVAHESAELPSWIAAKRIFDEIPLYIHPGLFDHKQRELKRLERIVNSLSNPLSFIRLVGRSATNRLRRSSERQTAESKR